MPRFYGVYRSCPFRPARSAFGGGGDGMGTRPVGVAIAILTIGLVGGASAAAEGERPAFVLEIQNRAGIPEGDVDRAKTEVERIFEDAGVGMTWADGADSTAGGGAPGGAGRPRRVSVLLLNITRDSQAGAEGCALGLAVPPRSTAYVFFNRLIAATRTRPVDLALVLGRAIAHEVGHVLLPPGRHSAHGLMRAELDFGLANPPRFTREEGETLRAGLAVAIAKR